MKKDEIIEYTKEWCNKNNVVTPKIVFTKFYGKSYGTYYPKKNQITIRKKRKNTLIHELCHHLDYCLNGSSKHNKRFYDLCKQNGIQGKRFIR